MSAATCTGDCPSCFRRAINQPEETDFAAADDVLIRRVLVPDADTYLAQHAHRYDHTTLVATGAVRLWEGEQDRGVLRAPTTVFIRAGVFHRFHTLEAGTQLYCIHNVSRAGTIEVATENSLPGVT